MYFPLFCKSNGSLLEGASHPEELVLEAKALGLPGLALADRDGVYGVVRAHVQAKRSDVRLVIGAETLIEDEPEPGGRIVLLARNRAGYANLCRLLTRGRLRDPGPGPDGRTPASRKSFAGVAAEEVAAHADGIHALWGAPPSSLAADRFPEETARLFREAFDDRLDVLLPRHLNADDVPREARLRRRARRLGLPVAAAVEVLYHHPKRRALQDVLTAIRNGVPLSEAGRRLRPNARHFLHSPDRFDRLFADDPGAVARTLEIADGCRFSLDDIRYRYPAEKPPDGMSSNDRLERLAFEGAAGRYPDGITPKVSNQLRAELALIAELDYGGYFLTMWEIVRFCREREILCQGRGSAANSAVCYCLGITEIDPVRAGLLFERFLSRERAEPPDIDLDIEHMRREEVIRFVYRRYGETRAAMVANTVRYRTRSAIRDVGRALGFSVSEVDRLARRFSHSQPVDAAQVRAAGWTPETPPVKHFIRLVDEIQGFPRHLSIHPGGFLLGSEPVANLVPVENAAMEGRTVIQWNKDDIEDLGLFKVDLLGLGALTQLRLCFQLLKKTRGVDISLAGIPRDDPETFAMIRRAETVGVFQIESRAQMAMLPRLRPRVWYDLVVQVAIVRPGPIAGGMVHPYLRRRRGDEPVTFLHPDLRPVLEKTLGVPLFQEQVMRLAMVGADYTPGEADQLRRDMGAWRRTGSMARHRTRLLEGMSRKGIPAEFAERIFRQIEGFGEYGFPESHAASFALIAYGAAYLLCHHPAEFACALLNAQPMGFYPPRTIVEDAKRRGVGFLPVDVTRSDRDCSMEADGAAGTVRMGLRYVKGLGADACERILKAREDAPFGSPSDLFRRAGLNARARAALASAGALETLQPEGRRAALWEAMGPTDASSRLADAASDEERSPLLPAKVPGLKPLTDLESIEWDLRSSSHSTRGHVLGPLRDRLRAEGYLAASEIPGLPHGSRVRHAGIVNSRQRPGTASGVVFMTLEDETGLANLILWNEVFERHGHIARTVAFLGVEGRLESVDGVHHVVVDRLFRPDIPLDTADDRSTMRSRDFR